ncbi:hypothetical protein CATMIT_01763, partial [Catenibacterium mitsuokai DSM 15897]
MAQRALRFGTEHPQLAARIAEHGGVAAAPGQRRAVQRAVVLGVFGAGDAGVEVAPHRLVLVPVHAQVQLALGVDVAIGVGVVAVDRVVQVRIQAAEDVLRVGVEEAVEQALDLVLARIGLGGDQVLALHLALQIEGQAAFADEAVVVTAAVAGGERLDVAADAVLGQGDVGQRDQEAVLAGDVDVEALLKRRPALALDLDRVVVRADRFQELGGELALQIDRE